MFLEGIDYQSQTLLVNNHFSIFCCVKTTSSGNFDKTVMHGQKI